MPWPWQVDLARWLPRLRLLVVLKARQLGVSWLLATYALWVALARRGSVVLLVSQTQDDALELLAKVAHVLEGLPDGGGRGAVRVLERRVRFAEWGSVIDALPSTRRAGRGRTAALVVADENAFHQWAGANFAALAPTVEAGGQLLVVSTANGPENHFAALWRRAVEGVPVVRPEALGGEWRLQHPLAVGARAARRGWVPLFLPYSAHPARDEGWWRRQRETYVQRRLFFQEYPREPEEAFLESGCPWFAPESVAEQRTLCVEPLPPGRWPAHLAGWSPEELHLYALPRPGLGYAGGADVAEGLAHGDASCLAVLGREEGRAAVVLVLHGRWPPEEFARRVAVVAELYPGLYGIERNNHGLAVLLAARRLGMRGLYHERPVLRRAGEPAVPGRAGWCTTAVTKPLLLDELEAAVRLRQVTVRDAPLLGELAAYQALPGGRGGAPSGGHDDRVMALGIAVQMLKLLPAGASPGEPGEEEAEGPAPVFGMGMAF